MTASSFINNIELTTFLASSTLLEDVLPRDRHPPLANELHAHTTSLVYKSTRETKRQQHHQGVRDKTSNTILAVVYIFFGRSSTDVCMTAASVARLPLFDSVIRKCFEAVLKIQKKKKICKRNSAVIAKHFFLYFSRCCSRAE